MKRAGLTSATEKNHCAPLRVFLFRRRQEMCPMKEYRKRDVSLLVGGGLDWLKGNERYNRSLLFPAPVSHFGGFKFALSSLFLQSFAIAD
jgi:hypothetical protein